MQRTKNLLWKATSLSMALAGSVALVVWVAMPDVAFADSGNGNGNSGGNGNGNGNSGGNGNGGGNDNKADKGSEGAGSTKGEKATVKAEKAAKKPKKPKKISLAGELGISRSELGALNAANASPNALKNASPNSRVGKIAAYRDAVLQGRVNAADLAEKMAELAALPVPARTAAEVDVDVQAAAADVAAKEAEVALLEADLAGVGGTDPVIEAELEAARIAVTEAEAAKAAVDAELAATVAYETLTDEVADLEQTVEDQPEVERSLLEAAANKPVTDAVEDAVKQLLGL